MDEVYLEIYSMSELCSAPIETVVTLFTIKYCNSKIGINLVLGQLKKNERPYTIDVSDLKYQIIDRDKIPYNASMCELPNITSRENSSCVAGLCAILRQIIKNETAGHPTHPYRSLLGFKESCLLACSEVSVWTRFCEVDLIYTLKFLSEEVAASCKLPDSIARFECHMSQPIRLHNLYKYVNSRKFVGEKSASEEDKKLPEHIYAEGSTITLADIIIFVCMHSAFTVLLAEHVLELIPLTAKWYERMIQDSVVAECLLSLPRRRSGTITRSYSLPVVVNQSLYKSDPKRYRPKCRIFTRQEDVVDSLALVENSSIDVTFDERPFGSEIAFDWAGVPFDATPDGGSVPIKRSQRKREQLENMCKAVLKLAKPGDVIVDFCSGSGHLGILVACLLPDCAVVLLENREESLNRAKERVSKLNLRNVRFCQSNLDYFKGDFDIGTSLHACGVATDLVIRSCLDKRAVFVSCPCCYGGLQDCHHLTYPRSDVFKKSLDKRSYAVISHAADQTHDQRNAKTKQGYRCMAIIDTDRRLQAQQFAYKVHLAKLVPETCTPKNNILVGIPKEKNLEPSLIHEKQGEQVIELSKRFESLL